MEKGGLGLIDAEQTTNSLRVKIIIIKKKKYMDDENKAAWKKKWNIL